MPGERGTASDRAISALAIAKVAFDRDASFLAYFEPFLEHCMFKAEPDLVSIPSLRGSIESQFGLTLPHAVIKTLLRRQEAQGHVIVESNICRIQRDTLSKANLDHEQREAMRQQNALVNKLIDFARPAEGQPWKKERAQRLLLEYVEEFSARLLDATLGAGELPAIDPDWEHDLRLVHAFVLHAEAGDPESFRFLEVLVKGKMLTDAVYLGEAEILGGVEPLADLQVFLDTPILLLMLGYAGEERAAPYLELLDMLKRQQAVVRCFDRNIEEAEGILAVAEQGARGQLGERVRGDIAAYLARTEAPSDIALKSDRLSSALLKLGIQPVPLGQLDARSAGLARSLSRQLRQHMPRYPERALDTDVSMLVTVHRLRGKTSARALPKCKAILVTRNYNLYKISAEFFQARDSGLTIPNCIPMSAFTTMVWVREPLSAPELPRDQIIAHAYAAMNPEDEEVWQDVNREAGEIRESGPVAMGDVHRLRIRGEARHALKDDFSDDGDPYVEGDVDQVRREAEENARADEKRRRERIERYARCAGRLTARALFVPIVPLLCLGVIFGPLGVLSGSASPAPTYLQWVGTAMFGALSLLSLLDGISLSRRVRWTAKRLESIAMRIALKLFA